MDSNLAFGNCIRLMYIEKDACIQNMNFRISIVVQGESKSGCKRRIPLFERKRVRNPLHPLLINHRTTWRNALENILYAGIIFSYKINRKQKNST